MIVIRCALYHFNEYSVYMHTTSVHQQQCNVALHALFISHTCTCSWPFTHVCMQHIHYISYSSTAGNNCVSPKGVTSSIQERDLMQITPSYSRCEPKHRKYAHTTGYQTNGGGGGIVVRVALCNSMPANRTYS